MNNKTISDQLYSQTKPQFDLLKLEAEKKFQADKIEIEKLYDFFKQLFQEKYKNLCHEITFGFFVSEYILKLNIPSANDNIDLIMLFARRLLEVLIVLKYIVKTGTYSEVINYCIHDEYQYYEGCVTRAAADAKLFPSLGKVDDMDKYYQEKIEELKQKHGGTGKRMPTIKKMADKTDMAEEYDYFYRFTSKLLHFCPFTLNGDMDLEHPVHKIIFVLRMAKYVENIKIELQKISNIVKEIPS